MNIDWANPTIQGAVVGAAIGAVVAIVLGLPTVAISLRTLKSARQQYELAMQERTAVYRQAHYQAAVALAQEVKKALDDFLTNAVGREVRARR